MGQGLQVWDENGVNLVDTDYRMTQIVGSIYVTSIDGLPIEEEVISGSNTILNYVDSIHVPEIASLSGTPFVHHIPYKEHAFKTLPATGNVSYPPEDIVARMVRIEGNYVKWKYQFFNPQSWQVVRYCASLIIWGVY